MRILFTLSLATLLTACAAPGSSIGRVAFSGQIADAPARLSLEVTLPKHYGLGGLDLVTNTPEDFGRKDSTVSIEIKDGAFSQEFGPFVYHITFWLLPPLGAFPRQPPPPIYAVRFSNSPSETYLIGMDSGSFRYEVYGTKTRQRMKREEAVWLLHEGDYVAVKTNADKTWHLKIRAKPNKAIKDVVAPSSKSGPAAK